MASDPDHIGFSVTRGKVRSRGFEIEAKTSLADGLDLTAAYTYLDPEILGGDNPGKVPSGIPTTRVTMWANYEVQSGALEGLNVGAGARFYGKTWKTDTNTTGKNASRVLVNASIGYDFSYMKPELKGLTAQLNVKNISIIAKQHAQVRGTMLKKVVRSLVRCEIVSKIVYGIPGGNLFSPGFYMTRILAMKAKNSKSIERQEN